ncbi:hypothetical protein ACQPUY_00495 [Clostridium nigeriense]|uniref:hypothetical protein n=1 Tax=Clostridium nigeriense TaxID=1805470 RepID=UPI003D32DCB5
MEDMIFNNNLNVTKEEQLQNFFNAFDSDRVEQLIEQVYGHKQKAIARAILNDYPNLVNTDLFSLKILVELLDDADYLNTQCRECKKEGNLMLFNKLLKSKLDVYSKINTILVEFGMTPKSRKSILVLDMEEQ